MRLFAAFDASLLLATTARLVVSGQPTPPTPDVCGGELLVRIRADGEEIDRLPGISQDACCDACQANEKCKLYVYGGAWKGIKAGCVLLASQDALYDAGVGGTPRYDTVILPGATEDVFDASSASSAASNCSTAEWGTCGDSKQGASCCPDGFFCQPWNTAHYQCMKNPDTVPARIVTDVEILGHELMTLLGESAGSCVEKCAQTEFCLGVTFVNETYNGPKCDLFDSIVTTRKRAGAVSTKMEASSASGSDM